MVVYCSIPINIHDLDLLPEEEKALSGYCLCWLENSDYKWILFGLVGKFLL